MLTFTLPVVHRNCFILCMITWWLGYYLLAWILFVLIALVEYDEVTNLYANYEQYYADRMEQEKGVKTQDVSEDAHILEQQIIWYTQEKAHMEQAALDLDIGDNNYDYHNIENEDLDNDNSAPRTEYTETEAYLTEMIYKEWHHPTGIVMPEAIHYDVHSVCMYHSYYTYKKWELELDKVTTSITAPSRELASQPHAPTSIHLLHTREYAAGYTHEVAYKTQSVVDIQGEGGTFNKQWV